MRVVLLRLHIPLRWHTHIVRLRVLSFEHSSPFSPCCVIDESGRKVTTKLIPHHSYSSNALRSPRTEHLHLCPLRDRRTAR